MLCNAYVDMANFSYHNTRGVTVRKLEKNFEGLEILHVVRNLNVVVDILAKLGSDRAQVPPGVFVEELTSLSSSNLNMSPLMLQHPAFRC
jgi:hypothetical protein